MPRERRHGKPAAVTRSAHGRALAGVIDQGVYSASNFLLTVLLAHRSSTTGFGVISVFLATFLLLSGISRGLNAEPIVIRFSSSVREQWHAATQAALVRSVAFAVPVGIASVAVVATFTSGESKVVGFAIGASLPIALAQDLLRYASLAHGLPTAALRSDSIALAFQLIASAVVLATGMSPVWFVVSWSAGTFVGGAACVVQLRLANGLRPRLEYLRVDRLSRNLAADYFVSLLGQQGVVYVIASVASLAAAGAVRAAQVAFFIPTLLGLGMQLAIVPELARTLSVSVDRFRATLKPITIGAVAVTVVSSAPILLLPARLGESVLGSSWDLARPLVVYVAVGTTLAALYVPAIAALRALAAGRITVIVRTSSLLITLILVSAGAVLDGARGSVIGIMVSAACQVVAWWSALVYELRRLSGNEPSAAFARRVLFDDPGRTGMQ